jgi:peptidyl-prolyl cis-trans isomerase C
LNYSDLASRKSNLSSLAIRALSLALALVMVFCFSACGRKENKSGQTLVRVNGEEITVLQVNDELQRAGIKPEQQDAATKQLLESLIDRQLILGEAMRNEVDRTASVVQAIERAKAQIISQAYLKSLDATIAKPTETEINDYYQKHPEYFSQRKQYNVQQVVISAKDFSSELRAVVDSAKSMDRVVSWMDNHNVKYARGLLSRNTTELPEQIVSKLKGMHQGQLFIVNEAESAMINTLVSIKDSPVAENVAAQQIEQYLLNKRIKEKVGAEIARLRASAKIEYLSASSPVASKQPK